MNMCNQNQSICIHVWEHSLHEYWGIIVNNIICVRVEVKPSAFYWDFWWPLLPLYQQLCLVQVYIHIAQCWWSGSIQMQPLQLIITDGSFVSQNKSTFLLYIWLYHMTRYIWSFHAINRNKSMCGFLKKGRTFIIKAIPLKEHRLA